MSSSPIAPYQELAEPILRADPTLSNDQRADLFDVFHQTKDPTELARKLQPYAIPDGTKKYLFDAKVMNTPAPDPVSKVKDAVSSLKDMDPNALQLAEKYPNVTKALVDAAIKSIEKPAGAPQDKGKVESKGQQAKAPQQAQESAPMPPRPDGNPHLPPIPEGHKRILASDGGVHDIPQENMDKARQIDPRLYVMNPD